MTFLGNTTRRTGACAGLLVVAVALLAPVFNAQPASAHPLGNFTVNRHAVVEVGGPTLRVTYTLDEAEIPAFQERAELRRLGSDGFSEARAADILSGLVVEVDGRSVPLRLTDFRLARPDGQGGLTTLRLDLRFEGELPSSAMAASSRRLTVTDSNEPDRAGWREIVIVARGEGRVIRTSTESDTSDRLRRYPEGGLDVPLDLRSGEAEVVFGTTTAPPQAFGPVEVIESRRAEPGGTRLTSLVGRPDLNAAAVLAMLGVAFVVGGGHALAPGHGKTVMAAYLAGTSGRPVDAVLLGLIVSAMHSASVLALAGMLFAVSRTAAVERVYPVLTIISGVTVVGVGTWLASVRLRRFHAVNLSTRTHELMGAEAHAHGYGSHDHGGHHHAHDEVAPMSRRGLALLAVSGGLVPSPTAVIVLISAFALQRAALGLALVAAFSAGLAATLTTVGLALVYGRRVIERRGGERLLRVAPLAGAVALVVVGVVVVVRGAAAL